MIDEKKALGHMKKSGFGSKEKISEAKKFISKYNKLPPHQSAISKTKGK